MTMILKQLSSHTRAFVTISLISLKLIVFDYNSLIHCPEVIILVPKDFSLQELLNGILTFALSSIVAEI